MYTVAISTGDGSVISDYRWLSLRLGLSEVITGKCTLSWRVKPQRDAQAGATVGQLDADLMERRDRFDQTEAKSTSRRAAATFQPIKAPKHTCALFGWDSRPAIAHGDGYRTWHLAGYETD